MSKVNDKVLPYNTGKVQIGLLYMPKSDYFPDEDASLVQSAILKKGLSKWSCASSAMLVSLLLLAAFLWVFALFATNVKW